MRTFSCPILALVLVAALPAQPVQLQLPPMPVQPGVPFTVTVLGSFLSTGGPQLFLLRPSGELIAPVAWGHGHGGSSGPVTRMQFTPPSSGDGSSGSFVLLFLDGYRSVVARVDVGASTSMPSTHMFPLSVPRGHATTTFCFANSSPSLQTITGRLDVLAPGGTASLAGVNLRSHVLQSGHIYFVELPIAALPNGPYVVRAQWTDGANQSHSATHGVQSTAYPPIETDLQLPGGREIPRGGSIPVRVVGGPSNIATPRLYAILLGAAPGTTVMPSGHSLPVSFTDPFVTESVISGLGIIDTGVGTMRRETVAFGHGVRTVHIGEGRIRHPNLARLLNVRLRVCGLVLADAAIFGTRAWMPSQSEDLVLR